MSDVATQQQSLRCPGCDRVHQEDGRFCPLCGYNLSGMMEARHRNSLIGQVVAERYRVRKAVGRGGMGVVYQVEHILMGKVMAMKVLHPKWKAGSHQAKRFRQEIRVVSRLSHVNTVSVFDCGETKDGSLYIVMEYLSGHDLEWMVQRDSVFSPERTAHIARQVCSSLTEAHARGIIHRDIKPANIFLLRDLDDFVKVLDFGIAKLTEPGEEKFTEAGLIIGTPYYMSPEQALGSSSMGPSTDVYSLGVVMYEMVTGCLPFGGHTVSDFIEAHLHHKPVPPTQVSSAPFNDLKLEGIIMRALEKEPHDRFSSIVEMKEALRSYLHEQTRKSALSEQSYVFVNDHSADIGVMTTLDVPAYEWKPQNTEQFQRETVSTPPPPSVQSWVSEPDVAREVETIDKRPLKKTLEDASAAEEEEAEVDSDVPQHEVAWRDSDEEVLPAELVASRADWDRVEIKWRRRSRLRSFFLILLLGSLVGGSGWLAWNYRARLLSSWIPQAEPKLRQENEPNNNILQATPVAIGPVIRGELGERLKTSSSDRDWFKFTLPNSGKYLISIRLQPPETIDVELGLYRLRQEKNGRQNIHRPIELLSVNNLRRGGKELIRSYLLTGGASYYVLVRELVVPGESPQEFRGKYKLQIKHESIKAGVEVEPNDQMGSAGVLSSKKSLSGYHDRSSDIDFYRLNIPPTQRKRRYVVRVAESPRSRAQYVLLNLQGHILRIQYRRRLRRSRMNPKLKAAGFPRRQWMREIRFSARGPVYLRIKTSKLGNLHWPYRIVWRRR